MTKTLFVSERSFAGQATSFHHATALLTELVRTLRELQPRLAADRPLRVHSELGQAKLTPSLSFRQWLAVQPTERTAAEVRKVLFGLLARGPHFDAEESFASLGAAVPYRLAGSGVEVTGSSVAAAVHGQGWLACLAEAGGFSQHPLEVEPVGAPPGQSIHVSNFSTVAQVAALRLQYRPNDRKHHRQSSGSSAVMDLRDEEADELLNQSIAAHGRKQRYAVKNDTVYEFQPEGGCVYHGYRIERAQELLEVPLEVRERLGRVR